MNKSLACFILLLFIAFQLNAQSLTKQEKIKLLFVEMHQDSIVIKTLNALGENMRNQMKTVLENPAYKIEGMDNKKLMDKIAEKSIERSKQNALKMLNEDLVSIYDKNFTEEEIDAYRVFYQSKAGKKMIEKTPDISKEIMAIMAAKYQMNNSQSILQDIADAMQEMAEEN